MFKYFLQDNKNKNESARYISPLKWGGLPQASSRPIRGCTPATASSPSCGRVVASATRSFASSFSLSATREYLACIVSHLCGCQDFRADG
jgi:hypothetical protein